MHVKQWSGDPVHVSHGYVQVWQSVGEWANTSYFPAGHSQVLRIVVLITYVDAHSVQWFPFVSHLVHGWIQG